MNLSRKTKIIFTTAVITAVAVLLFINLKNPQKELSYIIKAEEGVTSPHFAKVLGDLMGPPFLPGNHVVGLYNGEQIFPAMLEAIANAKHTIAFESFIYWSGTIGEKFANALTERAKAGVKVHVLLDWVGSDRVDEAHIKKMEEAGIEIVRYHALRWYNLARLNNRTHRKILVIDGKVGFTGGVGIADEWDGNGMHPEKWRDTHYRIEGPVVRQMQSAFMDNWLKTRPEVHHSKFYFPEIEEKGNLTAQMFKSSSREGGSSVRLMYLLAIAAARKSIYLESAYFVPDQRTIDDLVAAKKRGVEIHIIVPGKKTDSKILRHASRGQWGPLLEAGIRIYEYQPALFHCKVLIIDDYFVSVGSTNFDSRSFRLNDEANLNVLDSEFAKKELEIFKLDLSRSKEVSLEAWSNRPSKDKFVEKLTTLLHSQL